MILFITLCSFLSLSAQDNTSCVLISKYYNTYLKINKKEGYYTINDTIIKVTYAKIENKVAFFTNIEESISHDYYLTTSKIYTYLNKDSIVVSEVEALSNEDKKVTIFFSEESFSISDDEMEYRYINIEQEKKNISRRKKPRVKSPKK